LSPTSGVTAVFPSLWANLFTDSEAIRAACRNYLQIVGPFYALFGLALCLYFASQGAGCVAWPVIASVVRVLVIVLGRVGLRGSVQMAVQRRSGAGGVRSWQALGCRDGQSQVISLWFGAASRRPHTKGVSTLPLSGSDQPIC